MSDSVGSVSVEVVPDARGWSEKLRAQLRDQHVAVKADADTTEANAELDKVARTRTARVKVNVDKNPLEQGASSLDKFVGKLGLLPALAVAAGAALVPLAGTLGGIAAALAAPLAIAGGGATLFGVLAGFAVKDTEKQLKVIDSAQKKLDGLTKGTKAYAAQAKVLADAQKSLSPAQRGFSNAQSNFTASFQNFIGGPAGSALLSPLVQGMNLLSHILPSLTPIITAASGAFSTLLGGIGKAASSPGFDKFIHTVSGQVGHDIVGFGTAAGQIAKGLGSLFVVLDKSVGSSLVDELVRLTRAFANWASSKRGADAIQSFMDYFHRVGPQVGRTLGAVAGAIGHIVHALAPLGPPVLRVIQGIADAISGIPTPVLTALAGAFVSMVAFQKVGGFKGIGLVGKSFGAVTGKGGLLGGIASKAGVVPVYVTNPGFGGKGGPGGPGEPVPGRPGTPGVPGETVPNEGGVKGLGRSLARWGTAAVALDALGHTNAAASSAASSLFPQIFGPAGKPLAWSVFHGLPFGPQFTDLPHLTPKDALHAANSVFSGSGNGPSHQLPQVGFNAWNPDTAKGIGTLSARLGAVRADAASASRSLDMIGPHAAAASGTAVRTLARVQTQLFALQHPVKFQIISNTESAIKSLERLQAMQIPNKDFTVTETHYNRVVGPGGGMGRHATGGLITGPGTGTSDSIPSYLSNGEYVVNARAAAANRSLLDGINYGRRSYAPAATGGGATMPSHVTLRVGDQEFRAYVEGTADGVYHANQGYARAVYGP